MTQKKKVVKKPLKKTTAPKTPKVQKVSIKTTNKTLPQKKKSFWCRIFG